MSLEVALYLMRQTQIVNMQVGHDPVLGGILASLETLARENVTEQRTALVILPFLMESACRITRLVSVSLQA